jgi:hypothetical protein
MVRTLQNIFYCIEKPYDSAYLASDAFKEELGVDDVPICCRAATNQEGLVVIGYPYGTKP